MSSPKLERPVWREVPRLMIEGKPVLVGLLPGGLIGLRLKGQRATSMLTYPIGCLYGLALGMEKRRVKTERKRARRAKRLSRIFDAALPDEPNPETSEAFRRALDALPDRDIPYTVHTPPEFW